MNKNNRSKKIKLLILIIYLGFIAYFGFIAKIAGRTQVHSNAYNLIPFYSIRSYFMITDFFWLIGICNQYIRQHHGLYASWFFYPLAISQ